MILILLPGYYCYIIDFLHNLESSQMIDSTQANTRKAENNDLVNVINLDDSPRRKAKV